MRGRLVDLTMRIRSLSMPVYPGDPAPVRGSLARLESEGFEAGFWVLHEHVGTHVDAPAHFVPSGATVEELSLEDLQGPGAVLDFSWKPPGSVIGREEILEALRRGYLGAWRGWVVLVYTGYSELAGSPEWLRHPVLDPGAARLLVELGVKLLGVDAPSPDREPYEVHRILLSRGVPIVENLVGLDRLLGRRFYFAVYPLPLEGASGSPARAVAWVWD